MAPPSPAAARSIHEMTEPFTGLFPPNRYHSKNENGSQSYNYNEDNDNDNGQTNNITNKSTTMMMQPEKQLRKPPRRKKRHDKHKTHKTRMATNKKQQQQRQYLKFHSSSCDVGSDFHRRTQTTFDKIDPSVGAQKIYQRQKQIEKGKNTVGYDEYRRRVPFDQRIARSMDTPSTPDHTLDIPNRKWNGMVKAWRIALHKYDPKDLQDAFQEAQSAKQQYGDFNNGGNNNNEDYGDLNEFGNELIDRVDDDGISRQRRALAEAHEQGLLDLVVVDGDGAKQKKRIRSSDGQRREPARTSTVASSWSSPSTQSTSTKAAGPSSFFTATTASGVGTAAASAVKVTPSSSLLLSSRPVASGMGQEETYQHVVGSKEEGFFEDDGNSFMSEGDMSDDDDDDDLL